MVVCSGGNLGLAICFWRGFRFKMCTGQFVQQFWNWFSENVFAVSVNLAVAPTDCIRQLRWQPWNNAGSWKGKWEAGGSNGWRKWTDDVQSAATGNSSESGANSPVKQASYIDFKHLCMTMYKASGTLM